MSAPTFMMSIECCLKMAACWVDSLSLSTRFWNLVFVYKIDFAFTFKTFRCVGAFLFFLPLCVADEGSGEDVACGWPGEPDVLDVVKVPEMSSRFMFDSDSVIVSRLKFGIMQCWQSHITEDRSMSAYCSECMFWHSMWYHTRHWSQPWLLSCSLLQSKYLKQHPTPRAIHFEYSG